jgi:hypothetical protein
MDVAHLIERIDWLRALVLDRAQILERNCVEMMRLDVDGRIYASPYWRGGRYLYLVYPTGYRTRHACDGLTAPTRLQARPLCIARGACGASMDVTWTTVGAYR